MPGITPEQFLSKAKKNGRFARELQASDIQSPEWVVVGAFYSAIHYIHAYLAQINPNFVPSNHKVRKMFVNNTRELKPISRFYHRLSDKAWAARYTVVSFSLKFSQELIDDDLTPIENHVRSLMP